MSTEITNILLIEDNPADAGLVNIYLKDAFATNYRLTQINNLAGAMQKLLDNKFDIIISDLSLPDSSGLTTFINLSVANSDTPIIILTGNKDESLGLEAVKNGALDFLNKNHLDSAVLKRSITYSLERHNLQRKLISYSKKLKAKEIQLNEAQRMAHIGSWDWNLTTNTLSWSDELFRIHGIIPGNEPMTQDKIDQSIHPEDIGEVKKMSAKNFSDASKAFRNGKKQFVTPSMSYRIILPDGRERTLLGEGMIVMDDSGKPIQMVGTVQDITFFKTAERELRKANILLEERVVDRTKDLKKTIKQLEEEIANRKKSELEIKKLSFVISKTDNSILITDNTGKIQWVNEGFIRLTGYIPEDILGTHGEFIKHGTENKLHPQNPFFQKLFTEKQTISYESCSYKKDGTEYWVISTLTPILNTEGDIESIVVIDSDITSQKKAEQEILRSKKLAEESVRAKELFIANMSHEIRTPMNAIMGIVQLMQDTKLDESQKKYLRSLQFAGENLLYIINDILDFSKIESGKMSIEKIEFNISTLVNGLVNSMIYRAKEKNVELSFDLQKNIPENLVGDPVRLNQILTNLIGNAIKFTEKGYIKVIIKEKEKHDGGVTLKFDVEDTGIGIAKEKQEIVFAVFEQAQMETSRKYGGTGLGLSIVKRLVELQGGTVSLKSKLGKGSTFSFELTFPIAEVHPVKQEKDTQTDDTSDLSDKEVLLVEDNSLNQMVAEKFLESMGSKIDIAENGAKAVKMLKKKNYDLVLMDIQMPEMDGYEATRCIRNNFSGKKKNIPILAMTAHAFQGEEMKCRQAGMNDYITKPLNRNILLNKVRQLLITNTNTNNYDQKK